MRERGRVGAATLLAALALHAAVIAALVLLPSRATPPPPAEPEAMQLTLLTPGSVAEVAPAPPRDDQPAPAMPADPAVDVPPPPAAPGEAVGAVPPAPEVPASVPVVPDALADLPAAPDGLVAAAELPPPPPPAPEPPPTAKPAPAASKPATIAAAAPSIGRTLSTAPVAAAAGPTLGARLQDESCPDRVIVYPAAAEALRIAGRVRLRLRISDDGRVVEAAVAESSGFTVLDDAARNGIRGCRFLAALRDGRPVWSTASMPVTFQNPGGARR